MVDFIPWRGDPDDAPNPDCKNCGGSGYDDADHDGERFIPLRCACSDTGKEV